uniref:Uncharacterized protein n=1 Tax=Sciurus vulgaris TaxID=55149 RepID=A0A8D2DJB3_SCIVU
MAAPGRCGAGLVRARLGVWQLGPHAVREWVAPPRSLSGCQRRCVSCVRAAAFSSPGLASVSRQYGQSSAMDHFVGVSQPESSLTSCAPAVSMYRDEQNLLLLHPPDMPENSRGSTSGPPGTAGPKSMLHFNPHIQCPRPFFVFPVSKKVHTTRCQALGVITEKESQVVGTCKGSSRNKTKDEARQVFPTIRLQENDT